jgi:hypothetical protein
MKTPIRLITFILCNLLLWAGATAALGQRPISLAGLWEFSVGDSLFNDQIELPGSMLTNDKGTPISTKTQWTGSLYDSSYYFNPFMRPYRNEGPGTASEQVEMKLPFFLTPRKHYIGAAWYRRSVYVPDTWKGQRALLFLERPHIETTVWVNGHEVGHQLSLSTPHQYDVTEWLKPGERNQIVMRIYNGIENVCVGQDSHSVTDQTQGNWNGVAGRMQLMAVPKQFYIRQLRVYPNVEDAYATVRVWLGGELLKDDQLWKRFLQGTEILPTLRVSVATQGRVPNRGRTSRNCYVTDSILTLRIPLKDMLNLWDEFSPNTYILNAELGTDSYQTTFGMRKIEAKGRQFHINGRPLFLRGTVENCCFPETGFPPLDVDSWLYVFSRCRQWGLNHVRFHSYCPPEAAFIAADQVGIYLQVEGPTWPNHGVKLRRGMKIDQYLMDESRRIIDTYGNHPSFVFMAAGNEPAGDWVNYCNEWVRQMAEYDATKLYCGASVGGGWAWDNGSQYHVKGGARGLDWDKKAPQSADDYFDQMKFPRNYKGTEPNNTPIVAHEQGQWCVFPDLDEGRDYTGAYKASNLDIFRDLLQQNGMAEMGHKFLMASGKLQTLCYKYEIERNLRTPEYAGFQLLGLNDYSGQGSAFVGPLNVHWGAKGYVDDQEWTQFCSPFVPLAKFPRFVYTKRDTLVVPIEAYNALEGLLKNVKLRYTITTLKGADTCTVASGVLMPEGVSSRQAHKGLNIPVGKNTPIGTVVLPLNQVQAPAQLQLSVYTGNTKQNSWDFWVYPDASAPEIVAASITNATIEPMTATQPNGTNTKAAPVFVTDTLGQAALNVLARGGRVLIEAAGKVSLGSDVRQTYLPVFWNTSWFKMRPPHTTGAYIDKNHPLFQLFPTDDWSNLNWWELLNRAQVMNLMELPADYQSPIQPIDTWHVSRKLGMMVEANVLKGKLVITTMDLKKNLKERHAARQMRRALLAYMQGEQFCPTLTLTPETISHFFTRQAPAVNMFTNDSPDELKPKLAN